MKESYKRFLLRFASGCIAPGQRAFEYCRQLGMPESLIFIAPNATDRNYFRSKAESLLPIRNVLRTGANLHGFVILFVGRLKEAHKGISTLIQACGLLEKEGVSLCLVLAGGGPDNRYYRELVRKEGLRDIRFMGMLDRETLCRYYAMADVLVLPSRSEPWGFVLNEGMEFGLPLVVSEVVGAGPDLVIPGKNGFVIPVGGTSVLTQVLRVLEQDEALRLRMGETSCRIIERFSPDHWAQGVLRAVKTVADRSS
jgi:glycosyltransferase involved in cell wall biosynthesis